MSAYKEQIATRSSRFILQCIYSTDTSGARETLGLHDSIHDEGIASLALQPEDSKQVL